MQVPQQVEQREVRQQPVIEKKPEGGNKPLPPQEDDDEWSAVPAFLRRSKLK